MTPDPDKAPKRYAQREPWLLEPHYSAHVSAMTEEGLHEKAAIAAELAFRDQEIGRLRAALTRANRIIGEAADEAKRLQDEIDAAGPYKLVLPGTNA